MRKKYVAILLIVFVILISYFSYPAILHTLGQHLIVEDKLEKSDLILVLAGDNNGERVIEGVRLYKLGYAPKMLMSGGPLGWQLTAAQNMKKQAQASGVPGQAILLQNKSESTLEDALFSLSIVKKHTFKSVILVTSPTHTRRSAKVFKKIFSKHAIKIIVRPAQKSIFSLDKWWTRHEDTQLVVWEYVSLVFYFFKGY